MGSPESVCISLFFGCYSELFDLWNSLNAFSLNYLSKKNSFFFSSTSMKESCEFRVGIQIVISSKETRTFIIIDSCVRQQQQRKKNAFKSLLSFNATGFAWLCFFVCVSPYLIGLRRSNDLLHNKKKGSFSITLFCVMWITNR